MSGGGKASGVMGGKSVVGTERLGLGGDTHGGSGGGKVGGGGGYGRDGDGYVRLIMWEDTLENIILGTEHNDPLAYAPVLGFHHPIMIMLGRQG